MANYIVSDANLQSIANAIRGKAGTEALISFPTGFTSMINALVTLDDLDVSDQTAEATKSVGSGTRTISGTTWTSLASYTFQIPSGMLIEKSGATHSLTLWSVSGQRSGISGSYSYKIESTADTAAGTITATFSVRSQSSSGSRITMSNATVTFYLNYKTAGGTT